MSIPGRMARIGRWLGPWAKTDDAPEGIDRRHVRVKGSRDFDAWIYSRPDRAPDGSVLVMPGLHYAGPADPRFDRFSRVLAYAGYLVMAPFLPDYGEMMVRPSVVSDAEAAFDALLADRERPKGKPGIFSISFGSMPALRLAARRSEEISRLVVFGGFSSFRSSLRFALVGHGERKNDPLNAPVVILNLLPFVDGVETSDHEAFGALLREYCKASWGKEESKVPAMHRAIAERIADRAPEHLRPLFLVATRARPGVEEVADRALERAGDHFAWVDPRVHLGTVACPVTLVHGREDDVIPFEESLALKESLAKTRAELLLTGLYGHTNGGEGLLRGVDRIGESAREVQTMTRMLTAMARLSG
jgi:pimeloyl-ACP methyl ester carboxylesterase